jgi:hypothetical protein
MDTSSSNPSWRAEGLYVDLTGLINNSAGCMHWSILPKPKVSNVKGRVSCAEHEVVRKD